jgi:uncharacterized membrane protein YjjP (DUF1212 family)
MNSLYTPVITSRRIVLEYTEPQDSGQLSDADRIYQAVKTGKISIRQAEKIIAQQGITI